MKKYHVFKLPMPKNNQNTVAPFVLTQQLFFSFGGFRRPRKKPPDITLTTIGIILKFKSRVSDYHCKMIIETSEI